MLYIGYLMIVKGQNIKKIGFGKCYCLQQVHFAENLPLAMTPPPPQHQMSKLGTNKQTA